MECLRGKKRKFNLKTSHQDKTEHSNMTHDGQAASQESVLEPFAESLQQMGPI